MRTLASWAFLSGVMGASPTVDKFWHVEQIRKKIKKMARHEATCTLNQIQMSLRFLDVSLVNSELRSPSTCLTVYIGAWRGFQ